VNLSENSNVLSPQSLDNKIADDTTIVNCHPRSIGVENTRDSNINLVLPVVVHHEGFGNSFPLVITASYANWIYISPVAFGLRMVRRVAIRLLRWRPARLLL